MNALQLYDRDRLDEVTWLVGIDEAGRGALAGPVVAGACVLSRGFFEQTTAVERSALINDSKQLSAESRDGQFALLHELREEGLLDFDVGVGSVEEIASLNILGATRLAMRRAVEALATRAKDWELPAEAAAGPLFGPAPVRLLVDGSPLKPFPYAHEGLVKGDGTSLSVAMASIAAKVTRDREMVRLADSHPEYGFDRHKGYGTAAHRTALERWGACGEHRALFLRKFQLPTRAC